VLADRNAEGLSAVLAGVDTAAGHLALTCDMTDETAVGALAGGLRRDVGVLHGVVHAAGIHWLRPLQLTDSASLREMLNSHVTSAFALTRAVVAKRLVPSDGCSVVWFSSAAALQGGPGASAYSAAKGAVIAGARAVAVELARRKVRVNVIAPGVVKTPQSDAFLSKLPPEQVQAIADAHLLGIGRPEDVAGVVAFLLSADALWMTGSVVVVDGGLTAH